MADEIAPPPRPDAARQAALEAKAEAWKTFAERGDPESAYEQFLRARDLYRRLPDGGQDKLWEIERGLAITAGMMGDHEEALRCVDRAEIAAQRPRDRAKVWTTRAICLSHLGRDEEARDFAERALEATGDKQIQRVARQSLGVALLKMGGAHAFDSIAYLENAVLRAWACVEAGKYRVALREADRVQGYWACLVRGRACLGLVRHEDALAELRGCERFARQGAARFDSELAQVSYFGARREHSTLLFQVYADQGRWPEAFEAAERGRARTFFDRLTSERPRGNDGAVDSEEDRLLRAEIGSLRRVSRPSQAEARRLDELEQALQVRRGGRERMRPESDELLSVEEVRDRLEVGEAIVEYQITDQGIYALFLARDRFQQIRLDCDATEVLEAARDLPSWLMLARADEQRGKRGFFDWHFDNLGAALLGGIPLDGVEHLIVAPHGELNLVPFAALRLDGRYLIERCAISLAPSANIHVSLAGRARDATAPSNCLLVRDPTGTLEFVHQEEQTLREHFGEGLTVLSGREATREAVMRAMPGHSALHFATHAIFRPDRPALSHLDLTEGDRLYAQDIAGLNLSGVRTVVLSACESGRGEYKRAGEMVGLPRAFLLAGARSVMAAIWPVEDHPSLTMLVKEFYRRIGAAAEACRIAQLTSLRAGTPASLWASLAALGG